MWNAVKGHPLLHVEYHMFLAASLFAFQPLSILLLSQAGMHFAFVILVLWNVLLSYGPRQVGKRRQVGS